MADVGCDIHTYCEKRVGVGKWEAVPFAPFDWRSYGLYAFLAGVRNYSGVPTIAPPRGFPEDAAAATRAMFEEWGGDGHTHSWLTVDELLAFNYDAGVENRRVTREVAGGVFDGGCTCEPGEGRKTTWREFLGADYFRDIGRLKELGVDRVVFWFDK